MIADLILSQIQAGRQTVEDYTPLAGSIEWHLGRVYLEERGSQAFIVDSESVPYVVNNDGNIGIIAAELLFAHLAAADQMDTLDSNLFVLEIGIGVGLFARFFLDAFRKLCEQHGKNYYDRLCYVCGDYSPPMLRDAGQHGIFANHPGRYAMRQVDALDPAKWLPSDPLFAHCRGRPFQAVFLNYLLDCLPAVVLRIDEDEVRQLCVRTCLARNVDLKQHTDLTATDIARLAKRTDPDARKQLRSIFHLLASEYDYRPVNLETIPLANFAIEQARAAGQRRILHSYGAIQCLEGLRDLLAEPGFILMHDYGHTRLDQFEDFQHQRYSQSTFVGVNFAELKAHFDTAWIEPAEDDSTNLHARLLGNQIPGETSACFQERFGAPAARQLQEPAQRARAALKVGRVEQALTAYRAALELQPYNWLLMHEVSQLLLSMRQPAASMQMAKAALDCNPGCSSELWNMFGDGLFESGRTEEARQAYVRALAINPNDVRSRFNLAFVHTRCREYPEALARIAEALSLDRNGSFRDGLLRKQSEVIALLDARNQEDMWRAVNRTSTAAPAPKLSTGEPQTAPAKPEPVVAGPAAFMRTEPTPASSGR